MGYVASGTAVENALATNALRSGLFKGSELAVTIPSNASPIDYDYYDFEVDLTDFDTLFVKCKGYASSYETYLDIDSTREQTWVNSAVARTVDVSGYTGLHHIILGAIRFSTSQSSYVYYLWGK